MLIKTIVVDDEYNGRELLVCLLNQVVPDTIKICATCASVADAVESIEKFNPQLVFLDIEMPNESGFELFDKLKGVVNFEVIFTTAHKGYAIDAFKVNALDYILKPINPQELSKAIQKVIKRISPLPDGKADTYRQGSESLCRKIMVPSLDGMRFFQLDDIVRLEADGSYTRILFKSSPMFVSSKNLGDYEESLKSYKNFIRIHRSTVININEVLHFTNVRDIRMSDGGIVSVSRYNKELFLNLIKETFVATQG